MKEKIVGERYIKFFEYKLAFEAGELTLQEYGRSIAKLKLSEALLRKFTIRYQRDTANPPEHTMTKLEWESDFQEGTNL